MGENICKQCDRLGPNLQNTQTAQTTIKKEKQPNQKMRRP